MGSLRKIQSHKGRLKSDITKMANNQEISIESIAQIATLAANTAVEAILERKHEDVFTRHRGDIKGMRHR